MRIVNIAFELGERVVTNDELIAHIKQHSPHFRPNQDDLDAVLPKLFSKAGCQTRRWCGPEQRPIEMITRALTQAMEEANVDRDSVELIIHAGLGRGFMEAGQSYFVAKSMGMRRAHCFDVMDACNSWMRSLYIAHGLIASGKYKRIAVVNTECNMLYGGIANPTCFELGSLRDLDFCFPGMTLGDGVTATILDAADDDSWKFEFASVPELADACAVPVEHWDQFADPSYLLAQNGIHKFTCFGKQLNAGGKPSAMAVMEKLRAHHDSAKLIFAHGHSTFWETWGEEMGIDRTKLRWNTFPEIGNLASACLPVCIRMAEDAGELSPGDEALTWMGSGGMSFSAARFIR